MVLLLPSVASILPAPLGRNVPRTCVHHLPLSLVRKLAGGINADNMVEESNRNVEDRGN